MHCTPEPIPHHYVTVWGSLAISEAGRFAIIYGTTNSKLNQAIS